MENEKVQWPDVDFVERLKNRDDGAFEELFRRFGPRLLKFGMKMCREREDAMDVFQDTLEKAYGSLGQLKEPAALKTWLFKVAANACLMRRRKPKALAEEIPLDEVMPDPAAEGGGPGWESLPEKAFERGEIRARLGEAVSSIPEKYRSVLLLRDVEGFTTEETAEILGISPDVVKMRLHRARAKVREELAGFFA